MILPLFWDIDRQQEENKVTYTITVNSNWLFDVLTWLAFICEKKQTNKKNMTWVEISNTRVLTPTLTD